MSLLNSFLNNIKYNCSLTWPEGQGARKITDLAWRWLTVGGDKEIREKLLEAVSGDSMTLARSALYALQPVDCNERIIAMRNFYKRWQNRPVILIRRL